ncbi:RDD family protein [Streptomonospora nanhaiensis]|uniref:RDD family protein n=1 Tax=Streptomonospora nanhaiensis TaxID=1323731 RepID=A0ABY6YT91_9ACTN|nr:RDD family protein [Streptomonospora nanhaiensis]WAE75206.1 RDD family protein [Streptomonospora nanhaiensis]
MNAPPPGPEHGVRPEGRQEPPHDRAYGHAPADPAETTVPAAGHAAPSAPPGPERLYPLAGWRTRVLARLIDLVLVALPALLVGLVVTLAWVGVQQVSNGSTQGIEDRYPVFLSVVWFAFYTGYETFALTRRHQTLGKRRLGLKVAPVEGTGSLGAVRITALVVRAALLALPFLFVYLLFFALGWLWWLLVAVMAVLTGGMAAWNRPNRQGLHDRIAGTVVLDVADPQAHPPAP